MASWDQWRGALTPELQRRGITIEVGGHGYMNFLRAENSDGTETEEYKQHPEWFGLDQNGRRSKSRRRVFNIADDAAFAKFAQNIVQYLEARPEIDVFELWPPDLAKWCEDDDCRRLGNSNDLMSLVTRRIATVLAREVPKVTVECIAYSNHLLPSQRYPLTKDIRVDFCPIHQNFQTQVDDPAHKENRQYVEALSAWKRQFKGEMTLYSYFRKYAWRSLPILLPGYMQHDLRYFHSNGLNGVSVYSVPGDWFTYELNHYALGRLAWNLDTDIDALVDDYVRHRFGPLAEPAGEAIAALVDIARQNCAIPFSKRQPPEQLRSAMARITQRQRKLAQACSKLNDPLASAYIAHAQRLDLMLEYLIMDLRTQIRRADKATPEELREMTDAIRAFFKQHADRGVVSVNNFALDRRLDNAYGAKRSKRQ